MLLVLIKKFKKRQMGTCTRQAESDKLAVLIEISQLSAEKLKRNEQSHNGLYLISPFTVIIAVLHRE